MAAEQGGVCARAVTAPVAGQEVVAGREVVQGRESSETDHKLTSSHCFCEKV